MKPRDCPGVTGVCMEMWQQKKVPERVGAACGWCWGLKGLVDEEKLWAQCDREAQRGKQK